VPELIVPLQFAVADGARTPVRCSKLARNRRAVAVKSRAEPRASKPPRWAGSPRPRRARPSGGLEANRSHHHGTADLAIDFPDELKSEFLQDFPASRSLPRELCLVADLIDVATSVALPGRDVRVASDLWYRRRAALHPTGQLSRNEIVARRRFSSKDSVTRLLDSPRARRDHDDPFDSTSRIKIGWGHQLSVFSDGTWRRGCGLQLFDSVV